MVGRPTRQAPVRLVRVVRHAAARLSRRRVLSRVVAAGALLAGGTLGCGKDTATPPLMPSAALYWSLGLNQHAVMLALTSPYDTVQLTATPRNAFGAPIAMTGAVLYRALDTMVTVSPTGLVTAHFVTVAERPALVTAVLQDPVQGITHTDTVRIAVTEMPPPQRVVTFSLQPIQGDSAKRALDFNDGTGNNGGVGGFAWPVRAVDDQLDTVCDVHHCALLVHYESSKPAIATIDPVTGSVTTKDTGHVVFRAQTLAYGRVLQDSVAFQVGYLLQGEIDIILAVVLGVLTVGFVAPKKLVLGVGAVVMFCNGQKLGNSLNPSPVDIAFDHPAAIDTASCGDPGDGYVPPTGSGNIAPMGGDTTQPWTYMACRRFPVPGVYRYHSTLFPSDTYEIDIRQDPR